MWTISKPRTWDVERGLTVIRMLRRTFDIHFCLRDDGRVLADVPGDVDDELARLIRHQKASIALALRHTAALQDTVANILALSDADRLQLQADIEAADSDDPNVLFDLLAFSEAQKRFQRDQAIKDLATKERAA